MSLAETVVVAAGEQNVTVARRSFGLGFDEAYEDHGDNTSLEDALAPPVVAETIHRDRRTHAFRMGELSVDSAVAVGLAGDHRSLSAAVAACAVARA